MPEYERTSIFGADLAGSGSFYTSYNSEVLDTRAGFSTGSFESVGNFSYGYGKQDASTQNGSPMHSWPESADAGRVFPVSGEDSLSAFGSGVLKNVSSYSINNSKET